jgi:hypothetical protein
MVLGSGTSKLLIPDEGVEILVSHREVAVTTAGTEVIQHYLTALSFSHHMSAVPSLSVDSDTAAVTGAYYLLTEVGLPYRKAERRWDLTLSLTGRRWRRGGRFASPPVP